MTWRTSSSRSSTHEDDRAGLHATGARKHRLAGRQRAAGRAALYELPPGQALCPYHAHAANEEMLIVLAGRPSLRVADGWRELAEAARWSRFPTARGRRAPGRQSRLRTGAILRAQQDDRPRDRPSTRTPARSAPCQRRPGRTRRVSGSASSPGDAGRLLGGRGAARGSPVTDPNLFQPAFDEHERATGIRAPPRPARAASRKRACSARASMSWIRAVPCAPTTGTRPRRRWLIVAQAGPACARPTGGAQLVAGEVGRPRDRGRGRAPGREPKLRAGAGACSSASSKRSRACAAIPIHARSLADARLRRVAGEDLAL